MSRHRSRGRGRGRKTVELVPRWVPPGHPHEWTLEQLDAYNDGLLNLGFHEWEVLDDKLHERPHDPTDCVECPRHTSDKTAEIVECEVDEVAVTPQLNRLLELEAIDLNSMTNAEWEEYEQLFDYIASNEPALFGELLATVEQDKPPAPKCTCNGPGSDEPKFTSHIGHCPAYKGTPYVSKSYCKHNHQEFKLDDGLTIAASGYRDVKYIDDEQIDIGVYLYDGWSRNRAVTTTPGLVVPWAASPMTQGIYLDWPDFSVPDNDVPVAAIVEWMLEQLKSGVKMETGCMGGHGRTGTMLALLLAAQGVNPPTAVKRVRETYCEKAIESASQLQYIADYYRSLFGGGWRSNKSLREAWDKDCKPSKSYGGGGNYSQKGSTGPGSGVTTYYSTDSSWAKGRVWSSKDGRYIDPPSQDGSGTVQFGTIGVPRGGDKT